MDGAPGALAAIGVLLVVIFAPVWAAYLLLGALVGAVAAIAFHLHRLRR